MLLEHRFTDARPERLPAAEIVAAKPDVVMAGLNAAAVELRKLTREIPIVVAISLDPVAAGLAQSLARPGGNVTGITSPPPEVMGKRLRMLKQLLPHQPAEARGIGEQSAVLCILAAREQRREAMLAHEAREFLAQQEREALVAGERGSEPRRPARDGRPKHPDLRPTGSVADANRSRYRKRTPRALAEADP